MSVLTGGAGYIGSHAAHALAERDESIVVLDNLSSGLRDFVPSSAHFVERSVADSEFVRQTIRDRRVDVVMHFAGSISLPESIERPLVCYTNNTENSELLIQARVQERVRYFTFSSTAAVYGATESAPVRETTPTEPLNPYGRSRLMVDKLNNLDAIVLSALAWERRAVSSSRG